MVYLFIRMDLSHKKHLQIFLFIFGFIFFSVVSADFSSTNFILENPVNTIGGGHSTSSSFQYLSTEAQLIQGQSTSTSFTQNAGFLYYPTASSPVISATAGNAQVVLNWTASTGVLANITRYDVGISTTSGSGFVYSSLGNVLTNTKTSLTNGTAYYFKVRSYAAGILLSESSEVTATPVAPSGGGGGGGGGGGSGSTPSSSATTVIFTGRAYPKSSITLLRDAQVSATTIADANANFQITLSGLSGGNYIFSIYSEDSKGVRSSLLTFPISVTSGVTTKVGNIFIAPTIATDKSAVKRGDNISIFGQSAPTSEVTVSVNSEEEFFIKKTTDQNGAYLLNFDTSVLELGQHHTKSKAAINGEITAFGKTIAFTVGDKNILATPNAASFMKGDLNNDKKVNLIDFSIAAFWYKRALTADFMVTEQNHLNGDTKIDLVDFSIMAFYWTG